MREKQNSKPRRYSENRDKDVGEEKQKEEQTEKKEEGTEQKTEAKRERVVTEEEDEVGRQQRKESKAKRDRERRDLRIKNKVIFKDSPIFPILIQ